MAGFSHREIDAKWQDHWRDRGTFAEVAGCDGRVMLDDNRAAAVAFEWAHGIRDRPDVQVNHIWQRSQDVGAYTSLANLCLTPAFLSKLTDTDGAIRAMDRALRMRGTARSCSRRRAVRRRAGRGRCRPADRGCSVSQG